jgi:hypothetical protein
MTMHEETLTVVELSQAEVLTLAQAIDQVLADDDAATRLHPQYRTALRKLTTLLRYERD